MGLNTNKKPLHEGIGAFILHHKQSEWHQANG
jgi:hypothetical protein